MAKKKHKNKIKTNEERQSNWVASLNLYIKGENFKMAKIGTQKTITVEGIDYVLQHPGTREQTRIQDRFLGEGGAFSTEKAAEEMFKHIIVEPKVSFDYFDEHDGFEEVLKEAMNFLRSGK